MQEFFYFESFPQSSLVAFASKDKIKTQIVTMGLFVKNLGILFASFPHLDH